MTVFGFRTPLAERGPQPLGRFVATPAVRGYYLDFRVKTEVPTWPPPWFPFPGFHRFMGIAQWGLGAFERYVAGEGDAWLEAAARAAEHLVGEQQRSGPLKGGWPEPFAYAHTFRTGANWLSAMTQGQCASLLVRVGEATNDDRLSTAAAAALHPLELDVAVGGVRSRLGDGVFLEEYPTDPPSHVLNGGIFALWGAYDVWRALGDTTAERIFGDATTTLAANMQRWDLGYWSRYDLYPHPVVNVASPSYHTLHIDQLTALDSLAPGCGFLEAARRFESYRASRSSRGHALARKVYFRVRVRKTRGH
jgi:heparosan-N-sulfate-glucuronate 5-epimerase